MLPLLAKCAAIKVGIVGIRRATKEIAQRIATRIIPRDLRHLFHARATTPQLIEIVIGEKAYFSHGAMMP